MPNAYQSTHWTGIQIDNIYPVGSLYFSVNNIDPGTLFGGTWERIQDKFLLCAGETYEAGTTGGSTTSSKPSNNTSGGPSNNTSGGPSTNTSGGTAITVDQMPSHTHRLYCGYNDQEAHTNDGYDTIRYQQWARGGRGYKYGAVGVNYFIEHTGGGAAHTHTLSSHTHTLSSHTHTLSSHTHTCLPPYLAVYVWQRIS